MDILSVNKINRLYWLGRYAERVNTTIQYLLPYRDGSLDTQSLFSVEDFCCRLGIPVVYHTQEEFFHDYLFDKDNSCSVISAAGEMLGNGMVLRETISTPTLAYLQMCERALDSAITSDSPHIQLLWALDDIMAFRGSFDDFIEDAKVRNIIKVGMAVERVSLYCRLGYKTEQIPMELKRLFGHLGKTSLPFNQKTMEYLYDMVFDEPVSKYAAGAALLDLHQMAYAVETLVSV